MRCPSCREHMILEDDKWICFHCDLEFDIDFDWDKY